MRKINLIDAQYRQLREVREPIVHLKRGREEREKEEVKMPIVIILVGSR